MPVLLELTGGKGEKKYRRQHGVKISADHVRPYMSVEELWLQFWMNIGCHVMALSWGVSFIQVIFWKDHSGSCTEYRLCEGQR